MNILYFGTSTFAQPALRALLAQHEPVVGVVTQPDRPAGRGGKMTAPPVKDVAVSAGVPVLQPESCRTPEFLETARALAPDLIVVAAYGQFLPDALLALPRFGAVNLHGSLLPKYRGAAPIHRAIWHGETETGVCLMWMVRAMDAGDLIACVTEPIYDADTTGVLSARLAERSADLLLAWLPSLALGTAPHFPQDAQRVTLAPAIRKDECLIDWQQPVETLWRQIRALAPTPGAVTSFRGQPLKIMAAAPVQQITQIKEGHAGEIVEINPKCGFYIVAGAGILNILLLQPAGKRLMASADFLRGTHITLGERLGT
jgi:methionyl-tRNA formyltransferase